LIGAIKQAIDRLTRFHGTRSRAWSACIVCRDALDDAPELQRKKCAEEVCELDPA
jgi:hypothetical protein